MLARDGWTARAPRLGIWAWQALTSTVVVSAVLAGLALAVPAMPVVGSAAELLQACVMAVRAPYEAPGGGAAAAGGTLLAAAILARGGWCLAAGLFRARRERARHARVLAMVGSVRDDLGVTVLEDGRPAAYCLPGRGRRIVLTSAALTALEPHELNAVIAHERAHIRQRHHLVLACADALRRAFPFLPLFRHAAEETQRLVEMAADDEATARTGSLPLAGALVELAGAGAPASALAASGGHAADRVRRLLAPRQPLRRAVAWGWAVTVAVALALPVVLAAQPAVAATAMGSCPLPHFPLTPAEAAAL
nr:M56 family metallopeptidase [Streptomyces sp. HNM0574]